MRTRSKVIFAAIIILALVIVGVSLLLNQGSNPGAGLTVEKPAEVNIRILSAIPVEPWVREMAAKGASTQQLERCEEAKQKLAHLTADSPFFDRYKVLCDHYQKLRASA